MLEVLTLNGTMITDTGLTHLRAVHKLRKLELKDTQTTDAGVAALQKANPGLNVIPARSPSDGNA